MNVQQSIKLFSAALLMGIVWGCSPSAQVAKKTSTSEVYDDLYASADEIRSANLAERPVIQYNNGYQNGNSDYYSNQSQQNTATDEYYSQNWVNSRQAYQNNYSSNYASSYYSPYSSVNTWYNNPGITFGYAYSPWGGYSAYNSYGYDPFSWGSSRWSYGSGFNLGWNNYGYSSYYSPWGYSAYAYNPWGYSSYYDPWGRYSSYYGYGNTYVYNNYSSAVTGANKRYNWSNVDANKNYRSQSTYNGDYNSASRPSRGTTTGSRQDASSSQNANNNTYYSRPQRDGSSSYSRPATTTTPSNSNSNNAAWDWSGGNSSSSSQGRSTSSYSSGSSGGSSSGSSGGGSSGGGGGRSRGSR